MIQKDVFGKNQRIFETIPALPVDEDGPVFREPWEAQVFVLTVNLFESGHFSFREWTESLGAVIRDAPETENLDRRDTYYLQWVRALEHLIGEKNILLSEDLKKRKEAWTQAYLQTPHGKTVELKV